MLTTNKKLSKIFGEMASIYQLLEDGNQFRVRAYEDAERVLANLPESVESYDEKELEEIRGIGESIAEKIREFIDTGKIEKYEQLKKKVPSDFIELLEVEGIGPKTLQKLHHELGIDSKKGLLKALESGEIEELEGFGEKKVENIREAMARHEKASERILLAEAVDIAEELLAQLRDCVELNQAEIAGSIRRHRETIGDIDILVAAEAGERQEIIDCFVGLDLVDNVMVKGTKKVSCTLKAADRDADLRLIDPDEWGAALLYFTGSKSHNVHLRKMAQEKDWKINEYGLFSGDKKLAGKTEESIYKKLGLAYVPPEMREDNGEIELAGKDEVPELVDVPDIRGDLHLHSSWSDGTNDIAELAEYVREHYDYEYLVITDHSRSQRQAGGLDAEELRREFEEIDEINEKQGEAFLKKGVEVDILADGKLDLPDDVLQECDWVVASIHSRFKQDNTDRILAACDHPLVNAIGHPAGRLIGQREGYPLDMEKVIDRAKQTGTALEINAQPARMDLDDHWVRVAREAGVPLVIDTDSHSLGSFANMRFGVAQARRGWCTKSDILNTRSWKKVQEFVERKR